MLTKPLYPRVSLNALYGASFDLKVCARLCQTAYYIYFFFNIFIIVQHDASKIVHNWTMRC